MFSSYMVVLTHQTCSTLFYWIEQCFTSPPTQKHLD